MSKRGRLREIHGSRGRVVSNRGGVVYTREICLLPLVDDVTVPVAYLWVCFQ